jgi:predicted ArsR family transcriptional regulator
MSDGLTREFLAERDLRMFQMRKTGMSSQEIARKFGVSTKAVNYAIQRQLGRLNKEALLAYPEVLRMELERLDTLQQAVWPLTQHRKITAPDGSEVIVEPDLRAVQQALAIMDRRSKLLGMEAVNININDMSEAPIRATLADAADRPAAANEFDPETEARRLIELMGQAGVLPPGTVQELLGTDLPELNPAPQPIIDAEVIYPDEVIP